MKNIKIISLVLIVISFSSCTDLDEKLYDQVEGSTFFTTDEEVSLGIASVYQAFLNWGGSNNVWMLQGLSSDELLIPVRGGDWENGGAPLALHKHTWSESLPYLNDTWKTLYSIVARANTIIANIEGSGSLSESQKAAIAEVKTLRAMAYWQLLDLFGTPPLVTDAVIDPNNLPSNATSQELFDFIETEVLNAIADLPNIKPDRGRMDKNSARALLTNLYLNAETYTGSARWNDVISVSDDIINSGQYVLTEGSFPNNYAANNFNESTENIWVITGDPERAINNQMRFARLTLHYNQGEPYDIPGGFNGFCTIAEFYNTFSNDDLRKQKWLLEGQQYKSDGVTEILNRQGNPLIFTLDVPAERLTGPEIENAGVRFNKYDPRGAVFANGYYNSDFVLFNLAEIVFAKAEANARLGNFTEAASLIAPIMERSGLTPLVSANVEDVYNERGRELCFEGKRRTAMVRHNKFTTGTWLFKEVSEPYRNVFPIPQTQLDANPNLQQNQGY